MVKKKILLAAGLAGTAAMLLLVSRFVLKLHIRFNDRIAAADILSQILRGKVKQITGVKNMKDIIILGIPRGGVVIADIIARKLHADFGIIIVMKVGRPDNKDNALGAVVEDNTTYLDRTIIDKLNISPLYIDHEISEIKREIAFRIEFYRGRATTKNYNVRGRTVILVDDGAATGDTLVAAARSLKRDQPKNLIIATPVAPRETSRLLKREADMVEIISTVPSADFVTVGQFYRHFPPIMHEQVMEIMRNRNLLPT